jgi:hypothetical protein
LWYFRKYEEEKIRKPKSKLLYLRGGGAGEKKIKKNVNIKKEEEER